MNEAYQNGLGRYCASKGLECVATALDVASASEPGSTAGSSATNTSADRSSTSSPQQHGQDVSILVDTNEDSLAISPLPTYRPSVQHTYLPSITVLADAAASLAHAEVHAATLSPPWSVTEVSLPVQAEATALPEDVPASPGISAELPGPPVTDATSPVESVLSVSVRASPAETATVSVPRPGSKSTSVATSAPVSSAVPSSLAARIYTLEDNPKRTAHSMGLAGEQDAELMVSFRSSVMNEANQVDADIMQVYAGDLVSNHPPVHFNMLHDSFAPQDNAAKDAASERIEAAVSGNADELVRLYFRHVHPVYPVLAKTRFLQVYFGDSDIEGTIDTVSTPAISTCGTPESTSRGTSGTRAGKLSIPASVRGVVYGLASNFWKRNQANAAFPLNQHELFEDALASLQREFHGPDLWTLQACLLLLHENSAENATIETPRVWTLTAQAVACAQVIGLHRDPTNWSIAPWEKSLRKKLWWATFAADVWSSVCHGNPPHIYRESFTTPLLTMDDLAIDEDVPPALAGRIQCLVDQATVRTDVAKCARFFQTVAVSRIVHELLHSSL